MSHAIANVVVGYPIPRPVESFFGEYEIDPDEAGFKTFYHGSTTVPPAYAGVKTAAFDECSNPTRAELLLKLTTNDDQFVQARRHMVAAREAFADCLNEQLTLTDADRQALLDCLPTEPDVHVIWSTG